MRLDLGKYLLIFFSFILIGCSLERESVDSLGEVKHIFLVKKEVLYDNNNIEIRSNIPIDNVLELSRCKRENRNICNYVVIGLGDRTKILYRSNCLLCDADTLNNSQYDNVVKLIDVNRKNQTVEFFFNNSVNNSKNKFKLDLVSVESETDRELLMNIFK